MGKKWIACLMALLLVCGSIPAQAAAPELTSQSACVMDADTGEILYEKNAQQELPMASVTKTMTALVVLEHGDLTATTTATAEALATVDLDSTRVGFEAGEQLTIDELMYCMLVYSANDAANILAAAVGGSVDQFVAMMNEKAAALGLTNTHFMNTSGLHDENHYSTVREIALILQAALENETCAEILSAENYRASETEQHPDGLAMTNKFLYRVHHEYSLGGAEITAAKTGYTAEAMNCCASAGKTPDGRSVICVTANAWTGEFCIEDHIALYTKYCGSAEAEG